MMNIADIRKEYTLEKLDADSVKNDPIDQFNNWLEEAMKAEILEPTAMHLATVSAEGKPSGRIVLLKGIDTGFLFFTNYESKKGQDLAINPFASLTFYWAELERQVRIEGSIEKVSKDISEKYFHSRPKGSQIGAIVSPQSQVITDRSVLEEKIVSLEKQYQDSLPPRPEHWGGYRLLPIALEFWQGRASRLHDRIRYRKEGINWMIERLAP
jgi:pyridoxamine 5'-phosphate oxidase